MRIEKNKSLKAHNTFGFERSAQYYCEPKSREQLLEAIAYAHKNALPIFMLGAGSNIVLHTDIKGLVIKQCNENISYVNGDNHTLVTAGAGVNWHKLVLNAVNRGLYGIENLTLIPGNAGAAPMQNIGAYGVEISDVLTEVLVIDLETNEELTLSRADCEFSYRDSLFKSGQPGRFAITDITLSLHNTPVVNTGYKALSDALLELKIENPSAIEISNAVAAIRSAKLPDPSIIGNAGSFFKNPVIPNQQLEGLLRQFPDLPHHGNGELHSKIPAGWLVEKAGLKGYRDGDVGVHENQALVLVNYGDGSSGELLNLAKKVQSAVLDQFGVELEQEPTTIR